MIAISAGAICYNIIQFSFNCKLHHSNKNITNAMGDLPCNCLKYVFLKLS